MIFKRYNRIIRSTLVLFLLIAIILFYWQFQTQYRYELNRARTKFDQEAIALDKLLETTADYVEQMRLRANSFYQTSQLNFSEYILFDSLQNRADGEHFDLDQVPPPYSTDIVGNLTGSGAFGDRDDAFYREIALALTLNPLLQTAIKVIPNNVWAFYLSAQRFLNLYPWIRSDAFHYTDDLLASDTHQLALPRHNPERHHFWTAAYRDPANAGLVVTCGAPVDEQETFRGTVGLSVSLEAFNQLLRAFDYPVGRLLLVSDRGQLLAAPQQVNIAAAAVPPVTAAFPTALQAQIPALLQAEPRQWQQAGGYLLYQAPLQQAPWQLVFFAPQRDLVLPALGQVSLGLGLLLGGLGLLLLMANYLIEREFILPATQLITHIEAASQNQHPEIPVVPEDWQPWFQTISTIFRANQEMTAELVQREKMSSLGQLVAGIAHEINNPANFIYGNISYVRNYSDDLRGLIQLYQQHYPEPDKVIRDRTQEIDLPFIDHDFPKLLQSMEIGAERIREIILSLRNFARLDESESKRADLHQGLESTLTILENRLTADRGNWRIEVVKNYGELPSVECYPGLLNQVFLNLINNAIDALYEVRQRQLEQQQVPTAARLEITTRSPDPEHITIQITDNGDGIRPEIQSHLFEPFFTTKPVGQGTGLGLSISYQIVTQKHGGKLSCQSQLGQGTTFTIELPVQSAAAPQAFQGS